MNNHDNHVQPEPDWDAIGQLSDVDALRTALAEVGFPDAGDATPEAAVKSFSQWGARLFETGQARYGLALLRIAFTHTQRQKRGPHTRA